MFWQEDSDEQAGHVVPDNVVDVLYGIDCKYLPIDHAHSLSQAIQHALPWISDEPLAGIHLIHVAESGNGWFRPEDTSNELLCVSRRTRMTLRLPRNRLEDAEALTGKNLDIAGYPLTVGKSRIRSLNPLETIFSRYVQVPQNEADDEDGFLTEVVSTLHGFGVETRKILCGKIHSFEMPEGPVYCRSVLLADLEPTASVRIQEQGIGAGRQIGMGLFLPHKGIRAVKETS